MEIKVKVNDGKTLVQALEQRGKTLEQSKKTIKNNNASTIEKIIYCIVIIFFYFETRINSLLKK